MNCNQCGTQIPEGSAFCTKCGARLGVQGGIVQPQPPPPPPPAGYAAMPPPPPPPPYAPMTPPPAQTIMPPYAGPKRTNILAILSLIAGIAAFPLNFLLLLPSLAAVILGAIGLYQASKNPAMGGKVLAIIGIILGVIAGILWLSAFIACIPFFNEIQYY